MRKWLKPKRDKGTIHAFTLQQAATRMVAPMPTVEPVQRWIPCSERLPELFANKLGIEYSETVFVLTSGKKIMAAVMRSVPGDKAIWIAPFNFWEAWDEKITHWTEFPPLPEPPEEGGDENAAD